MLKRLKSSAEVHRRGNLSGEIIQRLTDSFHRAKEKEDPQLEAICYAIKLIGEQTGPGWKSSPDLFEGFERGIRHMLRIVLHLLRPEGPQLENPRTRYSQRQRRPFDYAWWTLETLPPPPPGVDAPSGSVLYKADKFRRDIGLPQREHHFQPSSLEELESLTEVFAAESRGQDREWCERILAKKDSYKSWFVSFARDRLELLDREEK